MRQWAAFVKKEGMELLRSGRLFLLLLLFCLIGVMNPAMAKLTPWLMELMSDQLAESGMMVGEIVVDAMTAWTQFYKNMPIMLLVMVVMFGGIVVGELQKGTLIPIVAKGMKRGRILGAKALAVAAVWTGGSILSFAITYAYSAYFWDNGIAAHLFFGAFCFWFFGIWILSVILPASAFANSAAMVILTVGISFAVSYLLGLIPAVKPYSPAYLLESLPLLTGGTVTGDYTAALCVTAGLTVFHMIAGVWLFNRKLM
ncbi:MAG: ABC transporter permease [Lachnospiraceae bacterium]|nr:ABC transporter permease [Lachnospiraceae bacterium]